MFPRPRSIIKFPDSARNRNAEEYKGTVFYRTFVLLAPFYNSGTRCIHINVCIGMHIINIYIYIILLYVFMWTISRALGDVPVCMCVCVYKLRRCTTKIWKILEEARHLLLWWSLEPTSRTRECSKFQGMDISILLRYYMTLLAVLLYI